MSDVQAETIEAARKILDPHTFRVTRRRADLGGIEVESSAVDYWKAVHALAEALAAGVLVDDHNDDATGLDLFLAFNPGLTERVWDVANHDYWNGKAVDLAARRSAVVPESNEREAIAFERGKRTVLATAPGWRDLIDYGNPYTPDRNNAVVPESKLGDALTDHSALIARLTDLEVPLPNGYQFLRLGKAGAEAVVAALEGGTR